MAIEQASECIDVVSVLELAKMLTDAQRRLLSLSAEAKSIAAVAAALANAAPPGKPEARRTLKCSRWCEPPAATGNWQLLLATP
jgi:hypothetical protein